MMQRRLTRAWSLRGSNVRGETDAIFIQRVYRRARMGVHVSATIGAIERERAVAARRASAAQAPGSR
jgi:hypothetical protein